MKPDEPTPETRVDLEALEKLFDATKDPWAHLRERLRAALSAAGDGRWYDMEKLLREVSVLFAGAPVLLREQAAALARRAAPTGHERLTCSQCGDWLDEHGQGPGDGGGCPGGEGRSARELWEHAKQGWAAAYDVEALHVVAGHANCDPEDCGIAKARLAGLRKLRQLGDDADLTVDEARLELGKDGIDVDAAVQQTRAYVTARTAAPTGQQQEAGALRGALVRLLETQAVSFSDEQAAAIDYACDEVLHCRVPVKRPRAWPSDKPPPPEPAAPPSAPQGLFKEATGLIEQIIEHFYWRTDDDSHRDVLECIEGAAREIAKRYGYDGYTWPALPLPESALLTKAAPLTQPAVPEKEHDNGSQSEVQGPQRHGAAGLESASDLRGVGPGLHGQRGEQGVLRGDAERIDQPHDPESSGGAVVQAEHGSLRGLHGGEVATPGVTLKEGVAPAPVWVCRKCGWNGAPEGLGAPPLAPPLLTRPGAVELAQRSPEMDRLLALAVQQKEETEAMLAKMTLSQRDRWIEEWAARVAPRLVADGCAIDRALAQDGPRAAPSSAAVETREGEE